MGIYFCVKLCNRDNPQLCDTMGTLRIPIFRISPNIFYFYTAFAGFSSFFKTDVMGENGGMI